MKMVEKATVELPDVKVSYEETWNFQFIYTTAHKPQADVYKTLKTWPDWQRGCLLPVSDADEEPEVHGDVIDVSVLLLLLL